MLLITVTDPLLLFLIYCAIGVGVLGLAAVAVRLFTGRRLLPSLPARKTARMSAPKLSRKQRKKLTKKSFEVGIATAEEVRARLGEPTSSEIKGITKTGTHERWVYDTPDGEQVFWFTDGVLTRIGE